MEGVAETPDWTPWGRARAAPRGLETAFHHPLVLLRRRGAAAMRVAAPSEAFVGDAGAFEWSPMPWALHGRRPWRGLVGLGPGKVFAGEGDRLFLIGDSICEQLFEGAGLGPASLAGWTQAFARRLAAAQARGIVHRHLVIPEAHAIYADAIPGAPKLSENRPLQQILREGGDALRSALVYPLDALVAGRAKAEVSHPHDVHLTGYGCFLVYRELLAALPGLDLSRAVEEKDLRLREVFVAGDVGRSVGAPGRRVAFHEPPPVPYKALVKGTSYRTYQVDVFETESPHLPRLTMFRTSNSTHLLPYLMRHFSRIVAVATNNVHEDLIESERPDYVLVEAPERYFAHRQVGESETDHGAWPLDPVGSFAAKSGHALPLPSSAESAAI